MDLQSFVSLKSSSELDNLSQQIINLINQMSGGKKNFKNHNNKGNQLLKNPKIQLLKDKVENKVNSVLNKLSELNFNNLLIEFIEFLNKLNEQEFKEVQKAFYLKMQSEVSFVKIYCDFLKVIGNVYRDYANYNISYFINIVETKFKHDYLDMEIPEEFDFLKALDDEDKDISEVKRINNLNIINALLMTNVINKDLQSQLDSVLLNQTNYFSDIYYWYQNKDLTKETKQTIKNIITNNALSMRDKVLLDNLLEEEVNEVKKQEGKRETKPVVKKEAIKTDTLDIETENIIEEYIYLESIDEIKAFIDERCKDALSKNKFCLYLFNKYFLESQENSEKILSLVKSMVKTQILFKSNLSRGLLMLHSKWTSDEISPDIDYENPHKKMKEVLLCLKNMGITKNLESLLKQYKIEYVEKMDL